MSDNCLLVTCMTNLHRLHEKLVKLSRPQGQIIDIKCENRNKSAILNFVLAIIKRVRELVIWKMHNKFGKDT